MMGVSHNRNTLGPPDQARVPLITGGKPLPKRGRLWEPYGGVKPSSKPRGRRGLENLFYSSQLPNKPSLIDIHSNSITQTVRTVGSGDKILAPMQWSGS